MQLNEKVFLKGLVYLNDFYDNFKFDLDNVNKVEVWYEVFSNFDDEVFTDMIKNYCRESVYAPSSPTALTEFMKGKMIEKRRSELSSEKAFELALDELRSRRYNIKGVIEYFKTENSAISKSVEELVSSFASIQNDADQIPFVKGAFIKVYDKHLEAEVKQIIIGKAFKLLE